MNDAKMQIDNWHTPCDLGPAKFHDKAFINENKHDSQIPQYENTHTTQFTKEKEPIASSQQQEQKNEGLLNKLLPLIGSINNGGLDITTILELFEKSGQGLGALGKLLPIIVPLLNGFKKKPPEETIDYSTINLDN